MYILTVIFFIWLNTLKGNSKASTVDIFKAENLKRHHNCFIKP